MKNLSVPNRLLYIINVLFVLLWFCTFLSPYINPQSFSFGALLAIGYPIMLLAHLLFILYWLVRFKKVIYLSLSVLILSYLFSVPVFQSKSKFKALAKDNSFSIMSFNSQLSYFSGGKKRRGTDTSIKNNPFLKSGKRRCFMSSGSPKRNSIKFKPSL